MKILEERNLKKYIAVLLLTLALVVGIFSGCVENGDEPEPTENNAPVADFTTSDPVDMMVTFTDASTDEDGDTLTYSWDFGDVLGTSTDQNPEYTYTANGIYTVTLIVSDGTDTATKEMEIQIGTGPTAAITAPEGNITVNTTADFMDASTIGDTNISTWDWDFGDGIGTSTEQNPSYTYVTAGTYTVTLTVNDEDGFTSTATAEVIVIEVSE
jgi:PKD repeat protein